MSSQSITSSRQRPHNHEAEAFLVGAMLNDQEVILRISAKLPVDAFYNERHRHVFTAIRDVFVRRHSVEILQVGEALEHKGLLNDIGGIPYLMELSDAIVQTSNWGSYLDIVWEKYLQRRLIDIGTIISNKGFEPEDDVDAAIQEAEQMMFDLGKKSHEGDFVSMDVVVSQTFNTISQRIGKDSHCIGVETGYMDVDSITAGFKPSDLIILAARPSMGKTAFALNVALNAARKNYPTAIFSLEMSRESLGMRFLAMDTGISSQRLQKGMLSHSEAEVLALKSARLSELPIFLDDTPLLGVPQVSAKLRRLMTEHPIKLVIIDYLQLMAAKSRVKEGRQQEISEISRGLKLTARELDVPMVVLSQLSRACEARIDKRPMLSDLRESGAIEQDADQVIMLYREEYYNRERTDLELKEVAEIIVGKNRQGPTGTAYLRFRQDLTRFENLEKFRSPDSGGE